MAQSTSRYLFSFGMIADVQYADLDDGYNYTKTRKRFYRNSINLLCEAIQTWNHMTPKPAFMLQLGDLIDGKNNEHEGMSQASWDKTLTEIEKFNGNVRDQNGLLKKSLKSA